MKTEPTTTPTYSNPIRAEYRGFSIRVFQYDDSPEFNAETKQYGGEWDDCFLSGCDTVAEALKCAKETINRELDAMTTITQSETKHTPGEWTVTTGLDRHQIKATKNGLDSNIAEIFAHGWGEVSTEQGDANARLMASAPDLLAALEALIADTECYCADNVATKAACPHCAARAAIAKAKGHQ